MEVYEGGCELKLLQTLEGHTDRVWSLSWNPATGSTGTPLVFASCSGDKTVRIWEQTPSPSSSYSSWHCKVSFTLISVTKQTNKPFFLMYWNFIRQSWKTRTREPSDLARGPHRENYSPLPASTPPLQFGKTSAAISNAFPL